MLLRAEFSRNPHGTVQRMEDGKLEEAPVRLQEGRPWGRVRLWRRMPAHAGTAGKSWVTHSMWRSGQCGSAAWMSSGWTPAEAGIYLTLERNLGVLSQFKSHVCSHPLEIRTDSLALNRMSAENQLTTRREF